MLLTKTRRFAIANHQWLCLNTHLHFWNCSALHKHEGLLQTFVQVCEELLKRRIWGQEDGSVGRGLLSNPEVLCSDPSTHMSPDAVVWLIPVLLTRGGRGDRRVPKKPGGQLIWCTHTWRKLRDLISNKVEGKKTPKMVPRHRHIHTQTRIRT